jgi:hypothetical protein
MNITHTRTEHNNIVDDVGKDLVGMMRKQLMKGQPLRIVFDSLDFIILANIILKNHCNSDMHWIGHYVTFDRVKSDNLDDQSPLVPNESSFDNGNYLLSKEELKAILDHYTVLAARVLVQFVPCLYPMAKVVPRNIKHE